MNYDDFLRTWNRALQQTRWPKSRPSPDESIHLRSLDRIYNIYIPFSNSPSNFHSFFVTVEFTWRWDSLLSARFATTEEDMLMQIFGDFGIHEDTDSPYLRIDFTFHATLQMDLYAPLPTSEAWRKWAKVVTDKIPQAFSDTFEKEHDEHVRCWCGEPSIEATCSSAGISYLSGVSLPGMILITLPRQWDDPDRPYEDDPYGQLLELFNWTYETAELWDKNLKELANDS